MLLPWDQQQLLDNCLTPSPWKAVGSTIGLAPAEHQCSLLLQCCKPALQQACNTFSQQYKCTAGNESHRIGPLKASNQTSTGGFTHLFLNEYIKHMLTRTHGACGNLKMCKEKCAAQEGRTVHPSASFCKSSYAVWIPAFHNQDKKCLEVTQVFKPNCKKC